MIEIPKLEIISVTSIIAGFIFFATGLLLVINSMNTLSDSVNPGVIRLLGIMIAIVGIVLLTSRSD